MKFQHGDEPPQLSRSSGSILKGTNFYDRGALMDPGSHGAFTWKAARRFTSDRHAMSREKGGRKLEGGWHTTIMDNVLSFVSLRGSDRARGPDTTSCDDEETPDYNTAAPAALH